MDLDRHVRLVLPARLLVPAALVLALLHPLSTASAASGTPAPLVGAASGRCLGVADGTTARGAPELLQDCSGAATQSWTLTAAGELRTAAGTRCLDVERESTAVGTRVLSWTCTGHTNQGWALPGDGTVRAAGTGLCLDVDRDRRTAGSRVQVWTCNSGANQRWARSRTDSQAPTAPTGLRTTSVTCQRISVAWSASTDDRAVTAYDVYHDGQLVTSVAGSVLTASFPDVPRVTWEVYVNARDAAGNVSQASPGVTVTPPPCAADTTAPTVPTALTATASGTSVVLGWGASTDAVGVSGYVVTRDGTAIATSGTTGYTDTGLSAGSHTYAVSARDVAGNTSAASAPVTVTTGSACTTPVCGTRQVGTDTDIPWGLVTLPDGKVLYTRRDAHDIALLDPATGVRTSIGTVPGVVSTDGEGGLLGLALSPTFATDRLLYLMGSTTTDNRVMRIRWPAGGKLDTASLRPLLTGIGRNKYHNGGRLRFGPDGMLYVSTGDSQNEVRAQDPSTLEGKVLRIRPDGTVPADNPFGNPVWSYGHRNPQGLAFDSRGRLWEQEFGNSVMDETNLIVRGGNYGWPTCEGTSSRSGAGCAAQGLVPPKATYPVAEGSCSGITVVSDVLFVACGRGSRLYRETISGDSLVDREQYLVGTYGRLRTVEPAPGGDLWLTTTNGGDKDSVPDDSDNRVLRVDLR